MDVADELSLLLGRDGEQGLHLVLAAMIECETGEDFLALVQRELRG